MTDLKILIEDFEYQQKYTYEQRVELFNKYGISTSTLFFVPMWALSQHICNICGINSDTYYREYGHGQKILNSKLLEETKKTSEKEKYPRIQTFDQNPNLIFVNNYFHNIEKCTIQGSQRRVIKFFLKDKLISVNNYGFLNMCLIPRNLYSSIDEWLVDFGYDVW
jgi:hypothetical protein